MSCGALFSSSARVERGRRVRVILWITWSIARTTTGEEQRSTKSHEQNTNHTKKHESQLGVVGSSFGNSSSNSETLLSLAITFPLRSIRILAGRFSTANVPAATGTEV